MADSDENRNPCAIPELTFRAKVHKKVLQKLDESKNLTDICSQKLMDLREEVRSILTNSGHCDPADLYPHLEKGNPDQIVILNMILEWIYPNGRENHIVFGSSHNAVKNQSSTNELPNMSLDSKVIETEATTEATTELTNMSLDSKVIETEAPKNDMITVDLKTQDTQLDPKQNPMPKKIIETEAPKNDMVTVDLNTQDTQLNPKPYPMPRKTMTPRHKFKRIKKGSKVQKIQSPGVHKMRFKPSHKLQIAKTPQLSHQIYHVTPQFLTLESLGVIVQKWF